MNTLRELSMCGRRVWHPGHEDAMRESVRR